MLKSKQRGVVICRSLGALLVLLVLLPGCGDPSVKFKEVADEGLPPEAVAVSKAFEAAAPGFKHPVKEALGLVRAGSQNPGAYAEAIPLLRKLAANPLISAGQKQALETLVGKLDAELSARNAR